MSDEVRRAQAASERIARMAAEGSVASARDSKARRGANLDPVAVGLDDVTCSPGTCDPQTLDVMDEDEACADTCASNRYDNDAVWAGQDL